MPLLDIPDLLGGPCTRLTVNAFRFVNDASLSDALAAFGSSSELGTSESIVIVRFSGPIGEKRIRMSERYFLQSVPTEELPEIRKTLKLSLGMPNPRAAFHFSIEATAVEDDDGLDEGELESVARIWAWLGESTDRLDARVTAGLQYDAREFTSAVPLPFEVPKELVAFDSIEGVSLVKRQSGPRSSILYEARVIARPTRLMVTVDFRRPLKNSASALLDEMKRAVEIGAFAVRPVVMGGA